MNQNVSDKKNKTGGDVTKAEVMPTPVIQMTEWDLFNNTAETPADRAEDKTETMDD